MLSFTEMFCMLVEELHVPQGLHVFIEKGVSFSLAVNTAVPGEGTACHYLTPAEARWRQEGSRVSVDP